MTPTNLLRVAKEVVALLEGSGVDWPPVDVIGHAANPAQLLASLRQSVGVLESTLEELRPEKRGATVALGLRHKDLEGSLDALQRGSDFVDDDLVDDLRELAVKCDVAAPTDEEVLPVKTVLEAALLMESLRQGDRREQLE